MFGHAIPASDTTNQQRFAYPLYSVLLFAPFALLPFSAAQAFAFAAATGPHDPIRVLVATATNNRQDKNNPGDIPPGELSRRAWPAAAATNHAYRPFAGSGGFLCSVESFGSGWLSGGDIDFEAATCPCCHHAIAGLGPGGVAGNEGLPPLVGMLCSGAPGNIRDPAPRMVDSLVGNPAPLRALCRRETSAHLSLPAWRRMAGFRHSGHCGSLDQLAVARFRPAVRDRIFRRGVSS